MEQETLFLFDNFNNSFDNLKNKLQNDLPRNLRLLNIRLRLAIDMKIDFKGEISLTKTKQVRDTYGFLIKMIECWNSYEVLFNFIAEVENHHKTSINFENKYFTSLLIESESISILKETLNQLKSKYTSDKKFNLDFNHFIKRIIEHKKIKTQLTNFSKNTLAYFNGNNNLSGVETIALIYAERNMYYHNGETVKMGMSYSNRQFLIQTLTRGFIKHILLLSTYIIEKETDRIDKQI